MTRARPRIAVLVSGGGRSLANLIDCIARGELQVEIALVISDRKKIGALDIARTAGIPVEVVRPRDCAGSAEFSERVFELLDARGVELAVLAGFLRLLPVPAAWRQRVINIHPALLPKFGGRGFYGEHVHRAVLEAGETESGCSVHYVDNEYDKGTLLLQDKVPVLPNDDVEQLAARVFAQECRSLPEAIRRHFAAPPRASPQLGES